MSSIHLEVDTDPEVRVHGEAGTFRRVLENLTGNAITAMGRGGGSLRIFVEACGSLARIGVEDSGPGIPEECTHAVTDLGFTTHSDTNSGIGLHFVQQVADRFQARLRILRTPQQTTRVFLEMPRLTPTR